MNENDVLAVAHSELKGWTLLPGGISNYSQGYCYHTQRNCKSLQTYIEQVLNQALVHYIQYYLEVWKARSITTNYSTYVGVTGWLTTS
jgi:hypothetical protein